MKKVIKVDWRASLAKLNVGERMPIQLSDVMTARVAASRLRKSGYQFSVEKSNGAYMATCLSRPEVAQRV